MTQDRRVSFILAIIALSLSLLPRTLTKAGMIGIIVRLSNLTIPSGTCSRALRGTEFLSLAQYEITGLLKVESLSRACDSLIDAAHARGACKGAGASRGLARGDNFRCGSMLSD